MITNYSFDIGEEFLAGIADFGLAAEEPDGGEGDYSDDEENRDGHDRLSNFAEK